MSTPTPTTASAPPSAERQITLISHSQLFYWWPVWVLGYFLAIWTAVENHRMAVLPAGAQVSRIQNGDTVRYEVAYPRSNPETVSLDYALKVRELKDEEPFPTRVSHRAWLGSVYILVIILTMLITNVPLRGLWSFVAIIIFVVIGLLFSVFHVWDNVFEYVQALRIYINMGGYIFMATATFIIWALSTWVFDQQVYMTVTPGQIKVCEHIGDSVRTYDTMGITFEKQRDDLFRHYILGFGSGDLIVRTSGAEQHKIHFPNVLGIGWKLPAIEDMIKERPTAV